MSSQQSHLDLGFDLDALLNKNNGRQNRIKKEYIKEGVSFFRVLPSFDTSNRRIDFEYATHWITGETGNKMVVECTRELEGYCPLCEAKNATDSLIKRLEGEFPDLKTRPKQASERLAILADQARSLGRSRTTYFNAINNAGEVVILELNATVSKALASKMADAVQKYGVDPTNMKNGVWFAFTKVGKGRDSVVVDFKRVTSNVNGKIVEEIDQSPLTDDLISRLPTSVGDLKNPDNMYIQTFSSKDLADFLRGTPLKNKYQKRTPQGDQAPTSSTPAVQAEPAPAPVVAQAPLVATVPLVATTNVVDIETEIAALRNLAKSPQ